MRRVCVIGNSSVETKIFTDAHLWGNNQANIRQVFVNVGGSGACSATFLSRLGFEVYFVTQIGKDLNAKKVLTALINAGVNTTYVNRKSATTLFYTIFDAFLNRQILIKNTNWEKAIILSSLREAIESTEILIICPTEFSIFLEALKMGKALGKTIISLPQAAFFDEPFDTFNEIIKYTDILFLSESEICRYFNVKDYLETINIIKPKKKKIIVITRGKSGCIIVSNKQVIKSSSMKGRVVDPSGAGDAFMAGFFWALEKNYDLRKAAYVGCVSGLIACKLPNLVEDGFPINEFNRKIKKYKIR